MYMQYTLNTTAGCCVHTLLLAEEWEGRKIADLSQSGLHRLFPKKTTKRINCYKRNNVRGNENKIQKITCTYSNPKEPNANISNSCHRSKNEVHNNNCYKNIIKREHLKKDEDHI